MAQNFSTSGAQTAGVLLKTIPEDQQAAIARELNVKLRSQFDDAAASVAIELVAGRSDVNLKDELLEVLRIRIENGFPDKVASLLNSFPELSGRLLKVAVDYLDTFDVQGVIDSTRNLSIEDEQNAVNGIDPDRQNTSDEIALQWLRFAKHALASDATHEREAGLFQSALKFLNVTHRSTALAARDLVFSLITSAAGQNHLAIVRDTITSLIMARDSKLQQTLGYALWMRLLAASDALDLSSIDIRNDGYWTPLLTGLRDGDAERRKLCLDILKRSVALAIDQGAIGAVARSDSASSTIVSYQYSRYCAVFETLVLARYTNLVVECERDLRLLASADSVIQSKWLYVLLATALDATTADQNRKFIGEWILRSDLFSSRFPEGLADFVSDSFLTWAMEGTLFVSSTKLHDGQSLSSRHGDRVSAFVCNILCQSSADAQVALLDAMFGYLIRRYATLFAYSAVHLVRGINKAFESSNKLSLTKGQAENLLFISALRTLPEVATDYLVLQCWNICKLSESHSGKVLADDLSPLARSRLQDLKSAAEILQQNLLSTGGATIASPTTSQRDVKTLASVAKCQDLLKFADNETTQSSAQLQHDLEDIWSDLEFLEYPRALLVKLPAVFFNAAVFRMAFEEDSNVEAGLRDLVVATLPRLLDLAQRRSFLLAPLMESLRKVVLTAPEAATILDLEDCILQVCQSPPEPSIDLRMEYATIPLLASHLDRSKDSCRDHYFGKGEGYGFAAYLDLVSRVGTPQPELIQSLLEKMLARWKKQKVPTPTMSAWKTTLQLEVMLLCFEQFAPIAPRETLDSMMKDFYFILSLEPLPRFRYLMEWSLVRIQIRHPDLCNQTLDMLATKDHQSNPKFLASLMKMGVMLATAESGTEAFAKSLATTFIALSSSSKIIIRHEAQWAFPQLMDHARAHNWTTVLENPAYTSLDEYIRSLPRFGDPPAERVMSKIDPVSDHTMTNLADGLWTDLDYTRPPYTTHEDFVTLYNDDAKLSTANWPASCMPLGPKIQKPPRPVTAADEDPSAQRPKQMTQEEAIALQTKGTAYLKTSLDEDSQRTVKHSLLVVASLIENPYNLGGLSRASEIFGAQAMYVRDPRIIAEKDFTSVAVSSHNHIDIMPLPVSDISEWVAVKKSEGWTVVGIEQTDRSVLLGDANATLPEKTILVLGSEREGMPAAVLGECDLLVEIPQVGVTRSLNVQTAAAIVLFEYGRQHGRK